MEDIYAPLSGLAQDQAANDARSVFYRERDAIAAAIARGENPYGGYQNAVNSIYNTYGRDSGISYQEVAGILGQAYPNDAEVTTNPTVNQPYLGPDGRYYQSQADYISQAKQNWQKSYAEMEQKHQDAINNHNKSMNELLDAKNNLLNQYKSGMDSNNAYFSNVSPDAFQSQSGNYNQKVLDAYNQGQKTIANNQAQIDYAENVNNQQYANNKGYLDSFDPSTGKYSASYSFSAPVVAAPTIAAVSVNPFEQAAKLNNSPWTPNYTGQNDKNKNQDPILKALYPNS